jgi:hypothetical protein
MSEEIKCKICNKVYASLSSRSNHMRRMHETKVTNNVTDVYKVLNDVLPKCDLKKPPEKCKFCEKILANRHSRWRHEKTCKDKNEDKLIVKENEMKELKNKVIQLEKLIKINNKSSNTKNINNTNNGNINNGSGNIINNHIHINALGCESINDKLTEKEKIDLLTSPLFKEIPHIELIRKIYNNEKFLEDRNTMITNLQNKSCLVYNGETKKFEAKNKSDHIDSLIDYRQKDIKDLFEGMQDNKKIKNNAKKLIEDYIDQFDNLKNTESYKKYKEEIIYIIYNCKEIMKKLKDDLENNEDESIII